MCRPKQQQQYDAPSRDLVVPNTTTTAKNTTGNDTLFQSSLVFSSSFCLDDTIAKISPPFWIPMMMMMMMMMRLKKKEGSSQSESRFLTTIITTTTTTFWCFYETTKVAPRRSFSFLCRLRRVFRSFVTSRKLLPKTKEKRPTKKALKKSLDTYASKKTNT